MNFIEAVQALADGRCEEIERNNIRMYLGDDGVLRYCKENHGKQFLPRDVAILATDWELVNPKPEMEEVEVVRYMCDQCKCITPTDQMPNFKCCESASGASNYYIKLTGTYTRPKPRTVKRGKLIGSKDIVLSSHHCDLNYEIPNDATIFAEWQEEVQG